VQWYEAYDAVNKQGRFILGGLSQGASVGAAGGWIMGGGHSALSASHGLGMIHSVTSAPPRIHLFHSPGVDNVIQFAVVTAEGNYLIVNAHRNADLFWALRGGGGGTYAIVVSATYRTHAEFPLTSVIFQANFTSATMAKSVVTEYVKMHPALADAGWGGYSFLTRDSLAFFYVAPNISLAQANATIQPFVNFAANATGGSALIFTAPYDSFHAWYEASFNSTGQVGTNEELGSRLLPRDEAANNAQNVAEIMLAVDGGVGLRYVLFQQSALHSTY
jgi:FAD/FMN-containing dehydrogenase